MKKKMNLTQVSADEMKETKAGTNSGKLPNGQCYCNCACFFEVDGYMDGKRNMNFHALDGLPAEYANWEMVPTHVLLNLG